MGKHKTTETTSDIELGTIDNVEHGETKHFLDDSASSISISMLETDGNKPKSAIQAPQFAYAKKMMKDCASLAKDYETESRYNRGVNNNINAALGILLSIVGGGSLLYNIFAMSVSDPNFGFMLTTNLITITTLFLQVYQSTYGFSNKATRFHATAGSYHNLAREIDMALRTGVDDRSDKVSEWMIAIENAISNIETEALPL